MNYQNDYWAKIYDKYNTGRHSYELAFYANECALVNGKCLEIATGTGMIFLNVIVSYSPDS